jgi:hypothetical protein
VIDDDQGCTLKIVCREVGTEIGAMAEDGAILHQPVAKKDFLAGNDIRSRKEDLAGRIDDPRRDGWLVGVGAIGEDAEKKKPTQDHDRNRLDPALCDEQAASGRLTHDARRAPEEAAGQPADDTAR